MLRERIFIDRAGLHRYNCPTYTSVHGSDGKAAMETATIISTSERRIRIDVPGPWGSMRGSLRLPFRSGINPHVDAVREHNTAWIIESGLAAADDYPLIDAIQ